MQNAYRDEDAALACAGWALEADRDLALRVYTSHLIGAEPDLVLHGGGNTSVKLRVVDVFGDWVDVIAVKGSGSDLASLKPSDLPLVRLAPLHRLLALPQLTDEAMVLAQRAAMLDPTAPNPSIEALLHAFLPAKFVDHSHADAILALTNHPDGLAHVHKALGDDILCVPYVKPGFDLARAAAQAFAASPGAKAMVLLQHGLFTWGETAKESYDLHIALVSAAERYLALHPHTRSRRVSQGEIAQAKARWIALAPQLRGALGRGVITAAAIDEESVGWSLDPRLEAWAAAGPLTPDHTIRTKPRACVLDLPEDRAGWAQAVARAITAYGERYEAYVAAQIARSGADVIRLSPKPCVFLIRGVGIVGTGATHKDAKVALDIARHTLATKEVAEGLGGFVPLSDDHLFDVEYWALEQAKLKRARQAPVLTGRVVVIFGAAGAIGTGVAQEVRAHGAEVVMVDFDADKLASSADVAGTQHTVCADLSDTEGVCSALDEVVARLGGLDALVLVTGAAEVALLQDQSTDGFERLWERNSRSVLVGVQEAAKRWIAQGLGGQIVLVGSKNVAGPGASFGAYSASKAAAHQLAKIAAIELAPHEITVNIVAPDAVFRNEHGGSVQSGLWEAIGADRAKSRGIAPEALAAYYQDRNLLHREITGRDVGKAVLFLIGSGAPITGATLPVDGGVPTAFLR